jgi:hypothetical protein
MDLKASVLKGLEIVKLNGSAAREAARDEEAFVPGILIVAIGGLASGLSSLFWMGGARGLIFGPIAAVIGSFIGVAVVYGVAYLLGGRGGYLELYRAVALGYVIGWLQIIPIVGGIAMLWMLPMLVIILENAWNMERGKAIAVVAIIVGIGLLLMILMGAFLMAMFMGMQRI